MTALARGALAVWAVVVVVTLFYEHPLVWPDEGVFGDTAYSLAEGRGFATPSLAGQIPYAGEHLAWTPPLHTTLVAGVFKLFGPSVEAMRALSIASAALALWAVWHLTRRLGAAPVIALAILLTDARFLRVAIVGRTDVLAIALAYWAFCVRRPFWKGALAGLAMSAHPAGLVAAGAAGLDLLLARQTRALLIMAAGVLAGLLPWAAQIALHPDAFAAQIGPQLARVSIPESTVLRQVTWNLDSRVPVAAALWVAIAAGVAGAARASRVLLFAALLGLAINLRRPEVMYVAWLIVPAAIGLAVLISRARHAPRIRLAAAVAVFGLIAGNAAYMTIRMVRSRATSYPAYADFMRRCAIDPAPAGTTVLIAGLPEIYLEVIDQRERLALRLPAATASADDRARILPEIDAIVFGAIRHDSSWEAAIDAEPGAWAIVPLRDAGGYGASLAMRRGREYALPAGCYQHFYSAVHHL